MDKTTLMPFVAYEQLPQQARKFISENFPRWNFVRATLDEEGEYDVFFGNGNKIGFSGGNDWKEIGCISGYIPLKILPDAISEFINDNFPAVSVVEASRGGSGYGLTLNNELKLQFNRNNRLVWLD